MTFIRRFDHVGITVADLDAVTAFFVSLGLEADQKMAIEGEFLDTVIGMTDARTQIVMETLLQQAVDFGVVCLGYRYGSSQLDISRMPLSEARFEKRQYLD